MKEIKNHWSEITPDPNDPQVTEARKRQLKSIKRKNSNDRIEYLTDLARGKKVLDVGVVEHDRQFIETSGWLHQYIAKSADSVLGIDIIESEVNYIKSLGYNVKVHDIIKEPLKETFDVIICGEVLEHIDNPRAFLANLGKCLNKEGVMAVTVPNPWYINASIKASFGKTPFVDSVDHVAWYDSPTLAEMGYRAGLKLEAYSYFNMPPAAFRSFMANLLIRIKPLLIVLGIKPEVFSKTMVYLFRKI